MEILRQRFLRGAVAEGHTKETALDVWRQVLTLAAYGFCKAHAASFAHITYQSAFLKAPFPPGLLRGTPQRRTGGKLSGLDHH